MVLYDFTIHIKLPNRVDYALALPLLLYRLLRHGYVFRRIPLTRGKFARVDPEDYYELIKYKWQACKFRHSFYARRTRCEGKARIMEHMHRVVMKAPRDKYVDHIDGDPLNNCKFNLRLATAAQNSRNRKVIPSKTSRYKGVYYDRIDGYYRARITFNGKLISIGLFKDEVEAARAYDKAAKKYHGQFARLNFPEK